VTADVHRAGHLAVAGPGGYQAQDLEFPLGAVPGTVAHLPDDARDWRAARPYPHSQGP